MAGMKKRFARILLSLALALGLGLTLGAAAWADGVSYLNRWWDGSSVQEKVENVSAYNVITGDTKTISGWYVVNGYYEFDSRLTVSGTANIVIVDGSTLYLKDGICVNSGNTLNIYGQRDGSGTLKCEADTNYNAAIGSDDEKGSGGIINIYGANVIADAASYGVDGAGIVHIGKARLQREGMEREPLRQQLVHREAALGILRRVHVEIGKGRDQHVAAEFGDLGAAQALRQRGIDPLDRAVVDGEITVGIGGKLLRRAGKDDAAVIQFHAIVLLSSVCFDGSRSRAKAPRSHSRAHSRAC